MCTVLLSRYTLQRCFFIYLTRSFPRFFSLIVLLSHTLLASGRALQHDISLGPRRVRCDDGVSSCNIHAYNTCVYESRGKTEINIVYSAYIKREKGFKGVPSSHTHGRRHFVVPGARQMRRRPLYRCRFLYDITVRERKS